MTELRPFKLSHFGRFFALSMNVSQTLQTKYGDIENMQGEGGGGYGARINFERIIACLKLSHFGRLLQYSV